MDRDEVEDYAATLVPKIERMLAKAPEVKPALRGATALAIVNVVSEVVTKIYGIDETRWACDGVGNELQRRIDKRARDARKAKRQHA